MIKGILTLIFIALSLQLSSQALKTKNLIVITLDGVRWQEIFTGADPKLLSKRKFTSDDTIAEKFSDPLPTNRREMLMPFLWKTIGRDGQLYGNRNFNNNVNCSNRHLFSYPGYSEMLVGFVDKSIKSNDPIRNPNKTVLDFIQSQPGFQDSVAGFATWEVMKLIASGGAQNFETSVSGQLATGNVSEREIFLNEMQDFITPQQGRTDAFTFFYAFEYLKRSRPRVMFISFDETDQNAHGGRYDQYLISANRIDRMISKLWDWIQSQQNYKNQTTMVITTDHGRGTKHSWKNHGRLVPGSGEIWLAVIGPDTEALGEIKVKNQYLQTQIAKTLAAFLGINYTNIKPVGQVIQYAISDRFYQPNRTFVRD